MYIYKRGIKKDQQHAPMGNKTSSVISESTTLIWASSWSVFPFAAGYCLTNENPEYKSRKQMIRELDLIDNDFDDHKDILDECVRIVSSYVASINDMLTDLLEKEGPCLPAWRSGYIRCTSLLYQRRAWAAIRAHLRITGHEDEYGKCPTTHVIDKAIRQCICDMFAQAIEQCNHHIGFFCQDTGLEIPNNVIKI